jgi:hypothetical protein
MGDKVLESSLHNWVNDRLSEMTTPHFSMWVENASRAGTPDWYFRDKYGAEMWIELKTADTAKSLDHALTGFEIRPVQRIWHLDYGLVPGSVSYFLFQVGRGAKARRYLVYAHDLFAATKISEGWLRDHEVYVVEVLFQ